jgi:hypothetical protein
VTKREQTKKKKILKKKKPIPRLTAEAPAVAAAIGWPAQVKKKKKKKKTNFLCTGTLAGRVLAVRALSLTKKKLFYFL